MEYLNYVYSNLEKMPEPSFNEKQTSKFIQKELLNLGYSVKEVGKTSLIVEYDSHIDGTVLAIRSDIDALEFIKDGKPVYIHACGHDANASIVLAMAKKISDEGIKKGKIKFIFQAAEEVGLGAREIIQSKYIDDVEEMIGIHLRPEADTKLGEASYGVMHSSICKVIMKLKGKESHASRPHLGTNVIDIGFSLINAIKSIYIDPNLSYSIKPTQFSTQGNTSNTIPYQAYITLDIRAETNEAMELLKEKLQNIIASIEQLYKTQIEIEVDNTIPSHNYNQELMDIVKRGIESVLGEANEPIYTTASEDFHYYSTDLGIKTAYIGLGADLKPGLHDRDMQFDKKCLSIGVDILDSIIKERLY